MRVLSNGTYVLPNVIDSVVLGSVSDDRVVRLENVVCTYFNVSVHDLKNWKTDSEAKKTVCFLLHYALNYSVGSIAKSYNINRLFLKNCITDFYKDCLINTNKLVMVNRLLKTSDIGVTRHF